MHLNLQVEKSDVIEAFRLLEVAMQQSATDHSTGNNCIPSSNSSFCFPSFPIPVTFKVIQSKVDSS